MTTWADGLSTITLFVEDLSAARSFYREVFGLPVLFEDEDSTVFRFGKMLVNLLERRAVDELVAPAAVAVPDAGSRFLLTIDVEDVDARCGQLGAHGVTLLNGPMDRPWGVRTASFMDPAGHIWEIAQRLESTEVSP